MAFKMATGSGKTVVMAMLIAWHTLNKLANPQDARFTDAFLSYSRHHDRDRLRVLLPNDPENYYRQRDIVSPDLLDGSGSQDHHHELPRVSLREKGAQLGNSRSPSWPMASAEARSPKRRTRWCVASPRAGHQEATSS